LDEWATTSHQGNFSDGRASDMFAPQVAGENTADTATAKTVVNGLVATVLGGVGALAGGELSWRNRPHSFTKRIAEIKQFFNQIVRDTRLLTTVSDNGKGIPREVQLEQSLGIIATFRELCASATKKDKPIDVNQVFDIAAIKNMKTFKEHQDKTSEALLDVLRQYCLQLDTEIEPLRTVEFYLRNVPLSDEQIQYNLDSFRRIQVNSNLPPIVNAFDLPKELKYAEEGFLPGSFVWLRKTTNRLKEIETYHLPSKLVYESNKAKLVAGIAGIAVGVLSFLTLGWLNKPKQPAVPKASTYQHKLSPYLLQTATPLKKHATQRQKRSTTVAEDG
jgi:hypothetical protein